MDSCDRWWGKSHRWGRWEVENEAELLESKNFSVGTMITQKRKCERCGFVEYSVQTVTVEGVTQDSSGS